MARGAAILSCAVRRSIRLFQNIENRLCTIDAIIDAITPGRADFFQDFQLLHLSARPHHGIVDETQQFLGSARSEERIGGIRLIIAVLCFILSPLASIQAQEMDKELSDLATKLANLIKENGKKKVTVLDFTDL
jgi:hypothetical protein